MNPKISAFFLVARWLGVRIAGTPATCLLRLGGLVLAAALVLAAPGRAATWEPVPAADRTATASAKFPGTDAEILLSELRQAGEGGGIADSVSLRGSNRAPLVIGGAPNRPGMPAASLPETVEEGRVRVKLYTANALQAYAKAVISLAGAPSGPDWKRGVEFVRARVVKPDGASVEVATQDLTWNRPEAARGASVEIAFPSLAPGDIVEYCWRRRVAGWRLGRFSCQQDVPVREYRLTLEGIPSGCTVTWLNCPGAEHGSSPEGGVSFVVRDLPAFKREAYMPGQWDCCAGVFVIANPDWRDPKGVWVGESARWSKVFDRSSVPSKTMQAAVRELLTGATTDDERLGRLYQFCQTELENVDRSDSERAQKLRDEFKDWRRRIIERDGPTDVSDFFATPEDILASNTDRAGLLDFYNAERGGLVERVQLEMREQQADQDGASSAGHSGAVSVGLVQEAWTARAGDADLVNAVFAALARAGGYTVHLSRSADKSVITKARENLGWTLLDRRIVVVETAGGMRFFDPGSYVLPVGMLRASVEGVPALRVKGENVESVQTPVSAADRTQMSRQARLALDSSGTLTGEVEERYTGHLAVSHKERCWKSTDEQAAKWFAGTVSARLPGAEVTAVSFTNLRSRELPVTVKYHVRVPGFGRATGERFAVTPSFFEAGETTLFPSPTRQYPICFPHAWSEQDDVEVLLPEGFNLASPSVPPPVGDSKVLGASYRMEYNKKSHSIRYRREFTLGGNGVITFRAEAYPALKNLFDQVSVSDGHLLTLAPVAPLNR